MRIGFCECSRKAHLCLRIPFAFYGQHVISTFFDQVNFLLSNGDCLFAHRTTELHYIIRKSPFSVAHLNDQDVAVDFSAVTTPNDRVAVIVTEPLTDNEVWNPLPIGRVVMFSEGEYLAD